jgi:predicted HTH transcriptional regulator
VTSALLNYVREEGSATQEELAKVFSLTKRQVRTRLDRHLYNDVIQLAYITTRAGEKMLREKKHELS